MNQFIEFTEEELEHEIWKKPAIRNIPHYLEVSNLGRVRTLDHITQKEFKGKQVSVHYKGRILKQTLCGGKENNRYLYITYYGIEGTKQIPVQRLVGFTFLNDSYFENAEINHKDENHFNNRVSNLNWITHADNNRYGTRSKRAGESSRGKRGPHKHPMTKHSEEFYKKHPNYKGNR